MRRLLAITLGLSLASGCGLLIGPEGKIALSVLREQRARWQALGITDYDYEFQRSCFCPAELTQPARLEVRAGLFTGAFDPATGAAIVVPGVSATWWPTIDSIFARIERDMQNDYQVQITYDSTRYFPRQASGDQARTIDEEYFQTATNLTPVNPQVRGAGNNRTSKP